MMQTGGLQRFVQRAARAREAAQERCEFCGEGLPEVHPHLLEIALREVRCVCRPCSILFDREAASLGKYRRIPDRRLYLEGFELDGERWEKLRLPVGMAYLFHSTPAGRVAAYYPGPMGATESQLDLEAWEE